MPENSSTPARSLPQPATIETIRLERGPDCWYAVTDDAFTIELMGTDRIPTAFTAATARADVLAAIKRLNPTARVEFSIAEVCESRIEYYGLERAYEVTVEDIEHREASGADTTRQRAFAKRLMEIIDAEDARAVARVA